MDIRKNTQSHCGYPQRLSSIIRASTYLIIWGLCIGIPAMAKAQFAIGPKFGAGLTAVQGEGVELADAPGVLFGWQWGVMAQKNFNKRWAVQPELLYIRKGYEAIEQDIAFGTFIFDGDIVTVYVELSLGAKFFLISKNDTDLYLLLGPYFGYLARGRFQGEEGLAGLTSPFNFELTFGSEGLDRFDFGFNSGIGGQFDLGKVWFFAEARYGQGLWNINGSALEGSLKNYGFHATFGWFIYLSGDR